MQNDHQPQIRFLLKNILLTAGVLGLIAGFVISLVIHAYWLSLVLFGSFLLLLDGIMWHGELTKTRKRSFVFPLLILAAGGCALLCGVLLKTAPEALAAFFDAYAPDIIFLLLLAAGAFIILCALTEPKRKLRYCTEQVTAVCTELRSNGKNDAPVYTFYYAGGEHQIAESTYTNYANPEIGETREIYIDPVSLDELYEPVRAKAVRRFSYVFGGCFVVLTLIGIFMMHVVS